jgi:Predicted membrane protein
MFKTKLNETATCIGLLLLRIVFGGMMLTHGWSKFEKMAELSKSFPDPFQIGVAPSFYLTLFSELFCAALVAIGFLTRLSVLPLIIVMAVAFFKIHANDSLGDKEMALLYLGAYLTILLSGPGKFSLDKLIWKK